MLPCMRNHISLHEQSVSNQDYKKGFRGRLTIGSKSVFSPRPWKHFCVPLLNKIVDDDPRTNKHGNPDDRGSIWYAGNYGGSSRAEIPDSRERPGSGQQSNPDVQQRWADNQPQTEQPNQEAGRPEPVEQPGTRGDQPAAREQPSLAVNQREHS